MKSVPKAGSQQHVESLGRVLDVLELFSREEPELSLTQIAERLGWPAPTAHRVVSTLVGRGFLTRHEGTKELRLGPSVMRLVAPLWSGSVLPDIAQPHLFRMADELGETVNLAILDGAEVLYLASSSGSFLLRAETPPGLRIGAHCTALGKCMLAQLEPEEAKAVLGSGPFPARTSKSVRTWQQLAPQLEQARVDGFAISLEEYEIGLNSLAVPVPTTNGTHAAINVAALASRVSPDDLISRFMPRLRTTAAAIARAQGLTAESP